VRTEPDWDVAVIDDRPRIVVNAAAVAAMVEASPLGRDAAMASLRAAMPADAHARIEAEVAR